MFVDDNASKLLVNRFNKGLTLAIFQAGRLVTGFFKKRVFTALESSLANNKLPRIASQAAATLKVPVVLIERGFEKKIKNADYPKMTTFSTAY